MIYETLKLDSSWDLTSDSLGNIATISTDTIESSAAAAAQDVASAVRTIQGELYYDTPQGIPYFLSVLGQNFSAQLFQAYAEQAALSVPGVDQAVATLNDVVNRQLTGTIEFIDENGTAMSAHF